MVNYVLMLLVVAAFRIEFLTAPPISMGLMMPLEREALFQIIARLL
jgi:hypothetical protein